MRTGRPEVELERRAQDGAVPAEGVLEAAERAAGRQVPVADRHPRRADAATRSPQGYARGGHPVLTGTC